MKYFQFLVLFIVPVLSFAQPARQDTTIAYARAGYEKDPVRSQFRKVIEKKDSTWVVSLLGRKDVLQEEVSYADEKLEVRKGRYARYENGNIVEKGAYDRGYKMGSWNTYYPNGQVSSNEYYHWGKLYGTYTKHWENGQLKEKGDYSNGKNIKSRTMFYQDGRPALKEFYNENGKVSGTYFDQQGNEVAYSAISEQPSFLGGSKAFERFLAKEMKYPVKAKKNNIQGTVKLQFTVLKDGSITAIEVVESNDEELSREAVRLLKESATWIPGKEFQEPVHMKTTASVTFTLK